MSSKDAKRSLLLLISMLALAGCANRGTPLEPQILTLNYATRTVNDATALITSVQGGQTTVSSLLSQDVCNFTADFSSQTPPQVFIYGVPGQTGFNVNLVSVAPVPKPLPTANPPSCTALREFEINIGGRTEALSIGTDTALTNGRVKLVDNREFARSEFFRARVQGFDSTNRRSNGSFQFISRVASGSNTVLIAEGSYALTP